MNQYWLKRLTQKGYSSDAENNEDCPKLLIRISTFICSSWQRTASLNNISVSSKLLKLIWESNEDLVEVLITDAGVILLQFKTPGVEKLLAWMGCHLISMKLCCERWPWLYALSFCKTWASFLPIDFHTLWRIRMQTVNSSCSGACTTHTPIVCHSLYFPSHD